MKKLYQWISLAGAKLVGRRHNRDVDPPGLKELKNSFISKSDSSITVRPDFNPISESLLSVGSFVDWNTGDNSDDYLNSVTGLYGTEDLIYLSKISPLTWDGTESSLACSTYSTGTVSITNGSSQVIGLLDAPEWFKNVWAGCFIAIDGDTKYYMISKVNSDFTLELTEEFAETTKAAVSYEIYRPHQYKHANYKLNIQPFTSGITYSCPSITMPINANDICGPFYSSVVENSTSEDFGRYVDDTDIDYGTPTGSSQWTVACSDSRWMAICPSSGSPDKKIMTSTTPQIQTSWTEVAAYPADFVFGGINCIIWDGAAFCVGGKKTSTGNAAFAYSADGAAWTVAECTSMPLLGPLYTYIASDGQGSGGTIMMVNSGGASPVYYTDDYGSTWTQAENATGGFTVVSYASGIVFVNSTFVIFYPVGGTSTGRYIHSTDGTDFSTGIYLPRPPSSMEYSIHGDFYLVGASADYGVGNLMKVSQLGGQGVITGDDVVGQVAGLEWADDKFIISDLTNNKVWSTSNGIDFQTQYDSGGAHSPAGAAFSKTNKVTVILSSDIGGSGGAAFIVSDMAASTTTWSASLFDPLSETHRSLTHSVLDGYVVLMGLREYHSTNNTWTYHPRRIRWTVPLTYNDFDGVGSGAAELDGSGAILDSRAVNGRIVTFESSAIGSISPRGFSADPWEYDVIKSNIRAISNPVVVDDMCYFIDDSGLLRATNGITVDSPPFSFDLSEYDDFNADSPVWLTYSPEFESLVVFNPSDANRYIYMIETENGYVSRIQAATVLNGAGADLAPKSVVCVENSSDRRMMVTYNPIVEDTDELVCASLSTGSTITGKDEWTSEAGDDTYHSTVFETGEVYLVPEGNKTSIKHIIVRTYTDGSTQASNPVVGVQLRSLEDSAWHCAGDTNGTITVDTDSCDGTSTAWSNTLDATNDPVYATPCLATQARIYVGSSVQTLGTDYTITDTKEITFGASPGDTVYAYWENQPEVKVEAGDIISTTEGYHMISSVTDQNSIVLDHYLSSGSDKTAVHIPAERMPNGDGEVKIGLNKLVEGVRIRVIVMHDASGDATVTKVTGVVVGHVPCGEKIVEP